MHCSHVHVNIGDLLPMICYCTLVNLLHWPSGVVPITTVREDEAHYNRQDLPHEQQDSYASLAGMTLSYSVLLSHHHHNLACVIEPYSTSSLYNTCASIH